MTNLPPLEMVLQTPPRDVQVFERGHIINRIHSKDPENAILIVINDPDRFNGMLTIVEANPKSNEAIRFFNAISYAEIVTDYGFTLVPLSSITDEGIRNHWVDEIRAEQEKSGREQKN